MASSNIARLGVVLGLDTAEFTAEIDRAIAENAKLKNAIKRDTNAAAGEIINLKYATEDYGKTLTKVQLIEREINSGRFMNATKEMKDRLRESAAAYDAVANSAKKTTFQMTEQQKMQLGFQTTDFVTQIASGQNAMVAFIQQGGQLKDSMGGIGNAFKAIGSVITPFRLAVAGAAATVGTLAFAMYKGYEETSKFQDSLTLTGRYVNMTNEQFKELADTISGKTAVGIGTVKESMMAIAASGQFTEKSISSVATAVAKYAKVAGITGEEAANKLMSGLDGSAAGAKRLNDQMHFLTLEQYKNIEALDKAGRSQEAAKIAADALSQMLEDQSRQLGYIEAGWVKAKNAMSAFWDYLKGIGREENKIATLNAELEQLESVDLTDMSERSKKAYQTRIDAINKEIAAIKERNAAQAEGAAKKQEESKKIDIYATAGGMDKQKQILADLAKTKYEVAIKTAMQTADESTRIELDAALKVQQEIAKYQAISDKDKAAFGAQLYEQMMLNVQTHLAERDRQLHDAEKKRQWDKDLKAFEEETAIKFRLMDEFAAARNKAADDKTALEIARKKLDLQNEMIGATEKERQIALSRLDYEQKIAVLKNSEKFRNASAADQQALLDAEEANQTLIESNIQVADSLKKIQETSSVVWSNMSTMIDNFIKTGKLGFKDFARSVIQDLLAIQLKMATVGFLNQAFTAMGMSFQLPGRASGGPVSGNSPYMVGEKGPELFIPSGSGTIVPNNQLTNMAPVTNVTNYNINAIDAKSFETRLLESSNTIWAANQYAGKNLATNYGRT